MDPQWKDELRHRRTHWGVLPWGWRQRHSRAFLSRLAAILDWALSIEGVVLSRSFQMSLRYSICCA